MNIFKYIRGIVETVIFNQRRWILQEDKTGIEVYVSNEIASQYTKQKMTELNKK